MNKLIRFQFVALLIVVVAFTTFAFASSQTDQPSGGEGVSTVSGWEVTTVHYLLAEDASMLAAVEFDLNGPADMVKASVSSPNGVFFNCQNTHGHHWACNINSIVSVSDLNELKVIATGG